MKKITLLIILMIAFNWQSNAQLTEGFEGGVPPSGWTSYGGEAPSVDGTEVWKVNTPAHTGSNAAFISYDNSSPGQNKQDWLVTSQVDLTSVSNAELRFFTRQEFPQVYGSQYEIRVSTNSQTTIGNFTPIASWDETTLNATYNVYEEKVVDLSAYDGMTIYIAFVHINDDGDSWYVDDVSVAAASSCDPPSGLSVTNITDTTADLSWGSVALEVGGYDWSVMNVGDDPDVDTPAASGSTATGVTMDTATGLTGSMQYNLYVRTICSGGPTAWSTASSFLTVPINDMVSDAIDLTTSIGSNSTGGTYTNVGATAEANETNYGTCWTNFGNPGADKADNSVWFKFTAQADANYTISTSYGASSLNDTVMHLYTIVDDTDLSSGVTEIACDDDGGTGFKAEISNVALVDQQEYYIQIDGGPDGPMGAVGTFDIGVFGPTLSVNTIKDEVALSYFPNPVKDKLTLKAQQNIQNVSVYNMLGQEVMRTNMNTQRGDLDMSSLQSGAYFVKVNINGKVETLRIIKK